MYHRATVCVQVDDLRAQLTQIEHTTTNKCQDLEDAVELFQTKARHSLHVTIM